MASSSVEIPKINLLASVKDICSDVRAVRTNIDKQIERLDRVDREISVVLKTLGQTGEPSAEDGLGWFGPAASALRFCRYPDDSADFQIDDGDWFNLPPRLAKFFLFLAFDERREEPVLAWRSREELSDLLRMEAAGPFRSQYVNNLIHLIRATLKEARLDPRLIQTNKKKGARFAFDSSCARVIEKDRV